MAVSVYRSAMDQRLARRDYVFDAVVAVAVLALVLTSVAVAAADSGGRTGLDYAVLTVSALALVARRRFPVTVLAITSVCVLVYYVRVQPDPAVAFPAIVAHYSAVAAGQRLRSVFAAAPFLVGSLVAGPATASAGLSTIETVQARVLSIGWFMAAGVMGELARQRRRQLDQVEQRALEAERTREETARRRAVEERLRIARDLHDSLTHSISVIKVQAGVAVHLAQKRGEEVPAALGAIQEASRDAMRELRSTLEVLRQDDADADGGLGRLPVLVERARMAGVAATVRVTGEARELPSAVETVAYRIVQEALTNVTKHAGAAAATVNVTYGADSLTIQVDDDGRGGAGRPPVPGNGLTGMRERVDALGGRLCAEPRPDGGFRVLAELPVGATS
jgi:signal transduction histidine kinase